MGAAKSSKEGHPHESGEDVGAEPGDGVVANARMLKRKRLTPPGSPASKRPPRGASPNTLTPNGEPADSTPKRSGSNLADHNVVKQDVGKPDSVVGTDRATEAVEPGADRVKDEGNEVVAKTQGEIQVSSAATADQHGQKADLDTVQAGDQSQSVATGVQVSSSLATSSLTTVAEEVKHHTIPSHAGMKGILPKAFALCCERFYSGVVEALCRLVSWLYKGVGLSVFSNGLSSQCECYESENA